jgi:DnaD/phage-associated family protein
MSGFSDQKDDKDVRVSEEKSANMSGFSDKDDKDVRVSEEKSANMSGFSDQKDDKDVRVSEEKSANMSGFSDKKLDNNNLPINKDELTKMIMKLIDEREFDDKINERFREDLDEFVEEYHSPASWIAEAFNEAKTYKAYSWGYVRKILINWQRRGKPDGAKKRRRPYPDRRYSQETPRSTHTGVRTKEDF